MSTRRGTSNLGSDLTRVKECASALSRSHSVSYREHMGDGGANTWNTKMALNCVAYCSGAHHGLGLGASTNAAFGHNRGALRRSEPVLLNC